MLKILSKIINLFSIKPKAIPSNSKMCPKCKGIGEYDVWIDCLYCDGQGYIEEQQYNKMLSDGEFD
jgi:DnaJ-class molecular chaperone